MSFCLETVTNYSLYATFTVAKLQLKLHLRKGNHPRFVFVYCMHNNLDNDLSPTSVVGGH